MGTSLSSSAITREMLAVSSVQPPGSVDGTDSQEFLGGCSEKNKKEKGVENCRFLKYGCSVVCLF